MSMVPFRQNFSAADILGHIILCGGLSHALLMFSSIPRFYSLHVSSILLGYDNQNRLHTLPSISCGARLLLNEAVTLNWKGTSESPLEVLKS